MLIFIDTEFTNFKQPELISIGLVTNDWQHEFYAELPVDKCQCSDFVIETVLPLLGTRTENQCTVKELKDRLFKWLEQFAHLDPQICYDYPGDWDLFCQALNEDVPGWLRGWNIQQYINDLKRDDYFVLYGFAPHHALNDAKANRHAFNSLPDTTKGKGFYF